MKQHILIVEDDELVQSLLGAYMEKEGYKVSLAVSGKEMLSVLDQESVDLILLDLGLPDEDGLTLARKVRARSAIPIIVITARKSRDDRITALEVGADDYLTKPFDPQELVLRAQNLLDRSAQTESGGGRPQISTLSFDGVSINLSAHTVTNSAGREVDLTRAEFNLLSGLANAPNRVLSRAHLLDAITQHDESPSDRMIDVLVSRLRKKLERNPKKPELIVTVPGCGYKFTAGRS